MAFVCVSGTRAALRKRCPVATPDAAASLPFAFLSRKLSADYFPHPFSFLSSLRRPRSFYYSAAAIRIQDAYPGLRIILAFCKPECDLVFASLPSEKFSLYLGPRER